MMPTIRVDVYSISISLDNRLVRKLYQAELPPDSLLSTGKLQFMRFVLNPQKKGRIEKLKNKNWIKTQ